MLGVFHDLGRGFAFGVAQHPVAVVEVAVQLHEPDGHEPVEPGVGHRLHDLLEAMPLDPLFQLLPLAGHGAGNGRPPMMATSPFSVTGSIFVGGQSIERRSIRDRLDEVAAGLRGVVFQLVAVFMVASYRIWMRSPLATASPKLLPQGIQGRCPRLSRFPGTSH